MSTTLVNKERFNPSRLSKLAVWVDAADSATIVQSGGYITQWTDKSSNSNSFLPLVLPPAITTTSVPNPTVLFPGWGLFPYSSANGNRLYMTLGPDGHTYAYITLQKGFYRIPPGGGTSTLYTAALGNTQHIYGVTAYNLDDIILALVVDSILGYAIGVLDVFGTYTQTPPGTFSNYWIPLSSGRAYTGLSSSYKFVYTIDTTKNQLIQVYPDSKSLTIVWSPPSDTTLTGIIGCAINGVYTYIYVSVFFVQKGRSGVIQLTEDPYGNVYNPVQFGSGIFTLENPVGLVTTSDNTLYIADVRYDPNAFYGDGGTNLFILRIPTDGNGAIVPPINNSWLTLGDGTQSGYSYGFYIGNDNNFYVAYDGGGGRAVAQIQPFQLVFGSKPYYGPTYSGSSVSFTYGGGFASKNPASELPTVSSKTFIVVYTCPGSMNVQLGQNVAGGAFGIAQISGLVYAPFQYAVGDLAFTPVIPGSGIQYAFASCDASSNVIRGMSGFDDNTMLSAAFQNIISTTPYFLGLPTNTLYTASGFSIYEFIATSNALSTSDRQEVEGYLAAKWGLTLPSSHPYKNFQPSGDQWILPTLPTTVSGLVSWLDMTIPGQSGTYIADRTGGSFNFLGNPLILSNINNHPSLYFPGNGNAFIQHAWSYPPIGSALFVFTISDTRSSLPIVAFEGGPNLVYTSPMLSIGMDQPATLNITPGPNLVFFAWGHSNVYLSVNGGPPVVGVDFNIGPSSNFFIGGDNLGHTIPAMNLGELVVYSQYFEDSERQLLEGYLAWKWNIQGNLPPKHPYAQESPIGATVYEVSPLNIPAQIPSLNMWLDAADSSTMVVVNSLVTSWADKSATSDVFVRFTSNTLPIYSSTTAGGASLPGVYFNGVCSLVGSLDAGITTATGSCFLVATVYGNAQVLMGGYVVGHPSDTSFGFYSDGVQVVSPIQGGQDYTMNSFPSLPSSSPAVLFAQINNDKDPIGQGSLQFSTPSSQGTNKTSFQAYPPYPSPWILGTATGSPLPQNVYIHEFLCFSDYFTDSQRQLVEGYLAWKWGLQSQLPRGHPYINARPQSA